MSSTDIILIIIAMFLFNISRQLVGIGKILLYRLRVEIPNHDISDVNNMSDPRQTGDE